MSGTHFYGDGCIPPHEQYTVDLSAKEEFFAKLHNVENELAKAEEVKEADTLREAITRASAIYDEAMAARHQMGSEKYGPVKFLSVNSIEEAMAEIVDLGNYARYTFIKLSLINDALRNDLLQDGVETLGANSFIPNGKFGT